MPLPSAYAYLVILDAQTPGVDYSRFVAEMQRSVDWWHYLSNTWIVLRRDTLVEMQNVLVPLIGTQDRLLIVPAKGPSVGWLPQDAWTWLNAHVPRDW